jgi:hypothetical protein
VLRAGQIQGEGFVDSGAQSGALKIIKNRGELRKLWHPKIERVKNSKKKEH